MSGQKHVSINAFAAANKSSFQPGMSLLDYYAAQAIPAIIAKVEYKQELHKEFINTVARMSYEIAVAMDGERKRLKNVF